MWGTESVSFMPGGHRTPEPAGRWSLALVCGLGALLLVAGLMARLITPQTLDRARMIGVEAIDFIRPPAEEIQEVLPTPPKIAPEPPPPSPPPPIPKTITETVPPVVMPEPAPLTPAVPPMRDLSPSRLMSDVHAPPKAPVVASPVVESVNAPVAAPVVKPVQPAPAFSEDLLPLYTPNPDFPRRAKRRHIEGWVNVQFTITVEGKVVDVQVLASEPEGVFEQATLQKVAQWKFKPQLLDGKPSPRRVVQTVYFKF
ncbi:MAG: TonB family protein [Hahellaceae bacterium]|nr:TonB family protein [Hahellaceae bacterium]MCP5170427.1 TonB family protein [Hahellaceae bacterium]